MRVNSRVRQPSPSVALQLPRACAAAPSAVQRPTPHHCSPPAPWHCGFPCLRDDVSLAPTQASPPLPRQRLPRSHGGSPPSVALQLSSAAPPSVARHLFPLRGTRQPSPSRAHRSPSPLRHGECSPARERASE